MRKRLDLFVFPGFQFLDLAGPLDVFKTVSYFVEPEPYDVRIVSVSGGTVESSSGVRVETEPAEGSPDTLVVVGGGGTDAFTTDERGLDLVRGLAGRSRRVASVCLGAFILAKTGFLDGRRATTHWRVAAKLQQEYPRIKVDGDKIFVKDGDVWTSAGVAACMDLAVAMVEEDFGAEISRAVARELVVYYRRPGGQFQFSAMQYLDPKSDRMRRVLAFMRDHLTEELSIDRLSEVAHLSPRQFSRTYKAEIGETPARSIESMRAEVARFRVETDDETIETIASEAGFGDIERMRRAFLRCFGHSPQTLRRLARSLMT